MKTLRKTVSFILMIMLLSQTVFVYSVSAAAVKITKFTQSPQKPQVNEKILFRVRVDGEVEKVYMSIDGEKDQNFTKKSTSIWEFEKKLTTVGTRYLKVTAVGANGEKDSQTATIEVIERTNSSSNANKEETTETTTRSYTGNVEKTTETTTQEIINLDGSEDFDGSSYNEESKINDNYFILSAEEDMAVLNEAAESSVFMFVGSSDFINKWKKQPIDSDNVNVSSYIKNGYTLVPLRAISEAFNADVSWVSDAKTAQISLSGKIISVPVDSDVMKVGERSVELQAPAEIKEGRVFVPLRAIAESLSKNVYYDANSKLIGITNKEYPLTDNGFELIKQAILQKF